jgi:hypothetical protein
LYLNILKLFEFFWLNYLNLCLDAKTKEIEKFGNERKKGNKKNKVALKYYKKKSKRYIYNNENKSESKTMKQKVIHKENIR